MIDVKGITSLCNLKGEVEDANGWRFESIFKAGEDSKKSLTVNRGGAYFCHFSNKGGHIVELYAHCIGRPVNVARVELIKKGLLERGFRMNSEVQVKEEVENRSGGKNLLDQIKTSGVNWLPVCEWRGLPIEAIEYFVPRGTFAWVDSWPEVGSAYVFLSSNPPIEGIPSEFQGASLRSSIPENSGESAWRQCGNHPIWVPEWNKNAEEVWIVEGQWDAMALWVAMRTFLEAEVFDKIQILAIVGSKKLEKRQDILSYFSLKKVIQIPDSDKAGEGYLIKTAKFLEQADVSHRLLRIPTGKGKDFNEWWKKGIQKQEFLDWMDCVDDFRIIGPQGDEVVMDSEFREKHKLRLDSVAEMDEAGDIVEVQVGRIKVQEDVTLDEILSITKGYPVINQYVRECCKVQSAPPIWHLMCFLTYFAAVCGRRFKFESGAEGILYPNIFTLLVGPSGLGKSEAMSMLRSICGSLIHNLYPGESFSAESLLEEFQTDGQKMMIINEFSSWTNHSESHYKSQAMKLFLDLYDCHRISEKNPYRHSFKTKGKAVTVTNPSLSILAACVNEQTQVNEDILRGGLIGRFIYAVGTAYHGEVVIPGRPSPKFRAFLEEFFKGIALTPIRADSCMRFSEKAYLIYERAFKKHREWENRLDYTGEMKTYSSRWGVQVFKFSMAFELMSPRHEWPLVTSDIIIGDHAVISAIKLVSILERSFYSMFKDQFHGVLMSREGRIRQKVLNYIKGYSGNEGHDGVSHKGIFRHIKVHKRDLDAAIETLLESGEIIKKMKSTGRRPRTTYLLVKEERDYDKAASEIVDISCNGHDRGGNAELHSAVAREQIRDGVGMGGQES